MTQQCWPCEREGQRGPAVVPGTCCIIATSALGHLCLKYCLLPAPKEGVTISMGGKFHSDKSTKSTLVLRLEPNRTKIFVCIFWSSSETLTHRDHIVQSKSHYPQCQPQVAFLEASLF